jgi:hypothetical protein
MNWLMKLFGLGKMADTANRVSLRQYCEACSGNDIPNLMRLEQLARKIGNELHRKGGLAEMRRVFDLLGTMPNRRRLEVLWDGTGGWRAWTLAGTPSERSSDIGERVKATLRVEGKSVVVEAFNARICTGEERDDMMGNLDLSIRFSEPVLIQTVVKNLSVKIPWKPEAKVFGVIGTGDAPGGLDVTLVTNTWPPEDCLSTEAGGIRLNPTRLPASVEVLWAEHSKDQPIGRVALKAVP